MILELMLMIQSLRGSQTSVNHQYNTALRYDYSFMETGRDVQRFVKSGIFVPLKGDSNYRLHKVSYSYARPSVKLFVERLSSQYRRSCGEKLVVTSLTRPRNRTPWNGSSKSVHPTGIALDARLSNSKKCRQAIESTLLYLETRGVVEATRERYPRHYHIAVFPEAYERYLASLTGTGEGLLF